MSTMINVGPMIAKIARDLLEGGTSVLSVDSVYDRLMAVYGDDIYSSEKRLAEVAVRQKIKAHLKNAQSVNVSESPAQLTLLKDGAPATLAIRQDGGDYAYVPLGMASLVDIDAATRAKQENIANARAALKRWERAIKPVRSIMEERAVSFGQARAILDASDTEKPKSRKVPRAKKVA